MDNNETRKYNHHTLMNWEEDANIIDMRVGMMICIADPDNEPDTGMPCAIYSRFPQDHIIKLLDEITRQLKSGEAHILRQPPMN